MATYRFTIFGPNNAQASITDKEIWDILEAYFDAKYNDIPLPNTLRQDIEEVATGKRKFIRTEATRRRQIELEKDEEDGSTN